MRDATGSNEAADQQLVLEQGTGMLETFLSLMPDAAVAVNRDGVIVAVNVRTESFFGYPANELEGKPIEVLVPERFRHAHRRDRAAVLVRPACPADGGWPRPVRSAPGRHRVPRGHQPGAHRGQRRRPRRGGGKGHNGEEGSSVRAGSAGRHRALLHRRHLLHDATWGNDQLEPGGGGSVRLFTYRRDRAPLQRVLPR